MKNNSGLTTRFAKRPERLEITPVPRTEFDLDLGKRISPEDFHREYLSTFANDNSDAFIKKYRDAPGYTPPQINRDAPESAVEDAW